jgi:aryl-alcohol dehydrogenase-like predicted oxidoreductase
VDKLSELAKKKNATNAQIAFAWVLAQKPWIAPIPGTTKIHRLEENRKVEQIILTHNDLREIERAFSAIHVQGERWPTHLQQRVGR